MDRSWEATLVPSSAKEQHNRGYAATFAAKRGLGPLHTALSTSRLASRRTSRPGAGSAPRDDSQAEDDTTWPPLEDPVVPTSQQGPPLRGNMASESSTATGEAMAAATEPRSSARSRGQSAGAAREVGASGEIGAKPGAEAGDDTVSLIAMADGVLADVDASGRSNGAAFDTPWSLLDDLSRESAAPAPRPQDSEDTVSLERVLQLVQATGVATQRAAAAASAVSALVESCPEELWSMRREEQRPGDVGEGPHQAETPASSGPSRDYYSEAEAGGGACNLFSRSGAAGSQSSGLSSRWRQALRASASPARRQGLQAELVRLQAAAADLEEERRQQDEAMARLEATAPLSVASGDAGSPGDARSWMSSSAADAADAPSLVPARVRRPPPRALSAARARRGSEAEAHSASAAPGRLSRMGRATSPGERYQAGVVPALQLGAMNMGPQPATFGPLNPESAARLREETRRIRDGAGLRGVPLHQLSHEYREIVRSLVRAHCGIVVGRPLTPSPPLFPQRHNGRAWRTLFQHYAAGSAEAQYVPTHRSRKDSHIASRRTLPVHLAGRRAGHTATGASTAQPANRTRRSTRQQGLPGHRTRAASGSAEAAMGWTRRGGGGVGGLRAFARTVSRQIEDEDEARFSGTESRRSGDEARRQRRRGGAAKEEAEQEDGMEDAFWAIEARLSLGSARETGQGARQGRETRGTEAQRPPQQQDGSDSSVSRSSGHTARASGSEDGAASDGNGGKEGVQPEENEDRDEGTEAGDGGAPGSALRVEDLQATARSGFLRREGPSSTRRLAFAQLLRFARQFEVVPNLCTRVRLFQLFGAAQGAESDVPTCPATPAPSLAAVRELGTYSSELMAGQRGGLTFGEFEVFLAFLAREAFGAGNAGAGPAPSLVAWLQGAQSGRGTVSARSNVLVQFRTGL